MSYTPNYQGVFLRGYGGVASYHYGAVWHSSGNLGELQGDSIREISGTFTNNGNSNAYNGTLPGTGTGVFQAYDRIGNIGSNEGGQQDGGMFDFYASRATPVSNEIRPLNMAVRYLIKAA
jgi:hypothetical protein